MFCVQFDLFNPKIWVQFDLFNPKIWVQFNEIWN
jgi:hypothetical protein